MTILSEDDFRRLLDKKGLKLDDKAFAAALQGARHLKAEVARLNDYLKADPDQSS